MSAAPSFPNHIACGVDLEGRAQSAVHAALWLARTHHCAVDFVHAFPPPPVLWVREESAPEWVAGRDAIQGALREALRLAIAGAPAELEFRADPESLSAFLHTGHPAQVLVEHARAVHADLVVLGPHRRRGRLDLGGTARGVLAHANAVWIQPGPARAVRRILAAVDAAPEASHVLARARDLARACGAEVTVVRAFQPPTLGAASSAADLLGPAYVVDHLRRREEEDFEREVAALSWGDVQHAQHFEHGDPAEVILARLEHHDVLVMGTHGRTALSAALLGSVAQAVLRETHAPVLALRIPRRTYLI